MRPLHRLGHWTSSSSVKTNVCAPRKFIRPDIFVDEIVFFFILALVETPMTIIRPKSRSLFTGNNGGASIVASSGSDSDTSSIQRCEY